MDSLPLKRNNIISVSRRTDIPAFYGEWFSNRLKEGFVGYVNPFNSKQRVFVSLNREDVVSFVFWSAHYAPFIPTLRMLKEQGYNFYLHFTITGYPKVFETNVPDKNFLIDTVRELSTFLKPEQIIWRYDPVLMSAQTDYNFHLENFESIAKELESHVKQCYFSFVQMYEKVKKSFYYANVKEETRINEPSLKHKQEIANALSTIVEKYGMTLFSCANDSLMIENVKRGKCIDGVFINDFFYGGNLPYKLKEQSTRKDCGCSEAIDIGAYDSCPHGCIYCYANTNKQKAVASYRQHDPDSCFLGCEKEQSDKWIEEKRMRNEGSSERFLF